MENQEKILRETHWWFIVLLAYLAVDVARIQQIMHFGFLRPGMICILFLSFKVLENGLYYTDIKQIRLIYFFLFLLIALAPISVNYYWPIQTAKAFFYFIPFIITIICCVVNVERLKILINFLTLITLYISLYSITHNGRGPGGYLGDENDLSLFINIMIPFSYYSLFTKQSKKAKFIFIITIFFCLTADVASFSRGGFVGLVAVIFCIWLFSSKKIISGMVICIAVLFIVIMGSYFFNGDTYTNEMETITDTNEGTAQARLNSWKAAWEMFLDMPWGVGGNNFQRHFPNYQPDFFSRNMYGRVAHSLWFTLLSETGIFGLIIYFSLISANYKDAIYILRIDPGNNNDLIYLNNFSKAIICSFVGNFVSGAFISVLYYPYTWYFTAFLVSAVKITNNIVTNQQKIINQ